MADRDSKRYYWLKLEKDFFKRHDIRIIEGMPNGKDYIIFYLKLLCESTSHEGYLRFSETIPYNENMLSTITNTNIDIVRSAIKVFTELQMMTIYDDGTIYFKQVEKMIGSETGNAERKRIYRENKKLLNGTNVGQCPLDIEKEKEIDIELDIEKEKNFIKKENNSIESLENLINELEMLKGCILTPKESTQLSKLYDDFGYTKVLNEMKKNSDKDNIIAYTFKVLYNPIQKEETPQQPQLTKITCWMDAFKIAHDETYPQQLRDEAKQYLDKH